MKKAGLMGLIILLTGIIACTMLVGKSSDTISLLKFKGVGYILNFSKGNFSVSSHSVKDDVVAVPACKNDILYCLPLDSKKGDALILRVKQLNDETASIAFDSIGCRINDRLVFLNLSSASAWLKSATRQDIEYLQLVGVSDSLSEDITQELKRKANWLPSDVGLLIDSKTNYLDELQGLLKPSWIWIGNTNLTSNQINKWNEIHPVEFMVLGESLGEINFKDFKKLDRLLLVELDSVSITRLDQLPQDISSLHVNKSRISNLDFIKSYAKVKELTFIDCASLRDIGSLNRLPHLKILSLADCDSIPDLSPVAELKELTWFAPPKNISEQQLASIVKNAPNLESLELINCHHIRSLHMLKDLHQLAYLRVQGTPVAEDSLFSFQHLKYLAYGSKESDDSTSVVKLQTKLPHTTVMASEPFCLSTGWLIVFFVLLILFTAIAVSIKNKVKA
jgi:hypothetical protein